MRIFFDPPRFREWRAKLGPLTLFYMDPCDIEIALNHKKQWGMFFDGQELYLDPEAGSSYEVAAFEIKNQEVFRVK